MIRAAALPDAMPPTDRPREQAPAHAHQRRTGLARLWHATGHSLAGLRAGWGEPAFRQEALLAQGWQGIAPGQAPGSLRLVAPAGGGQP